MITDVFSYIRQFLGFIKCAILLAMILQNNQGAVLVLSCFGFIIAVIEFIYVVIDTPKYAKFKFFKIAIIVQEILLSGLMILWSLSKNREEVKSGKLKNYGVAATATLLVQYLIFAVFIPSFLSLGSASETSRIQRPVDIDLKQYRRQVTPFY